MRHRQAGTYRCPRATFSRTRKSLASALLFLLTAGAFAFTPLATAAAGANGSDAVQLGSNALMGMVCEKSGSGPGTVPGAHYDRTGVANKEGGAYDVILGDDATDTGSDIIHFGMPYVWKELRITINTAGTQAQGSVRWEYYKASDMWGPLTLTSDSTNHFKNIGVGTVSWTPPSDWKANALPSPCGASTNRFHVRAVTDNVYTVQPMANWISATEYNLRVKVVDELNQPLSGLGSSDFTVENGTDNQIYAFRAGDEAGLYELALHGLASDRNYDVYAVPPSFLKSGKLPTGTLSNQLTELSGTPLASSFPIQVVVHDASNQPVPGAAVTIGKTDADAAVDDVHYFKASAQGALSVQKSLYADFDTSTDVQAQNVKPGAARATVVTLGGSTACNQGTQISAGSSVTCRGLRYNGVTSNPSTTPPSSSSCASCSSSESASNSNSKSSSSAPASTSGGLQPRLATPTARGNAYLATFVSVEDNAHLQLNFDGEADGSGLLRVDILLATGGSEVLVVVERSDTLNASWVTEAPEGQIFGYVSIRVFVGGELQEDSADFTTLEFTVPKEKLDGANADPDRIRLLRWSGDSWGALPTDPKEEEPEAYRFVAAGPGNGYFAIASDSAKAVGFELNWLWILTGVVALNLVVGGCLYTFRRKEEPASMDEFWAGRA